MGDEAVIHGSAVVAGMPADTPALWVQAASLGRLHAAGPLSVKLQGRQIALFVHNGAVHACNNRCPHEGYPLSEGHLDDGCVLTCQWHNWKFDLKSGANLYGGDRLRIFPVQLRGEQVWVDLADEPAAVRVTRVLGQLDAAMADNDLPRLARELARLEQAGSTPEQALAHAIERNHARLRYGMTHALAVPPVWLRLRDELSDPAERLACATEALGYLGFEVLREPEYSYTTERRAWDAGHFLAAVQAQDEAAALACIHGALDAGLGVRDLLPTLAEAALAHYNDFGHSVIYLSHVLALVERLGPAAQQPLLRAWLRSVIVATREDLLPDFRAYAQALAQWPLTAPVAAVAAVPTAATAAAAAAAVAGFAGTSEPSGTKPENEPALQPTCADFEGQSVRQTLAALLAHAAQPPELLWSLLLQSGAHHLLRFDEAVAVRSDNAVADNVGWLDFSHALTFAQALRTLLVHAPHLWPSGLMQMAMFCARNSGYLQEGLTTQAALQRWRVDAEPDFDARCRAQVLDHGLGLDIHAAHWLKTWMASRDAIAQGLPGDVQVSVQAAVNRLFQARIKQRHVLRNARQALTQVSREA